MPKGRFIVIEGLDGSGIGTQAEHLRIWCQQNGIEVLATKEPTDGPAGLLIKLALTKELRAMPEEFLALLFAADRLFHVDRDIRPALRKGTTVISDRYVLSSLAYQGVKIKDSDWLRQINAHATRPDLTIFLDVPVRDCVRRLQSDVWRGLDKVQLYERLPILEQVRHNFLELIPLMRDEGHSIAVIDGSEDIEVVGKGVLEAVAGILKRRRGVDAHDSGSRQLASMLGRERLAV